jgi:cold shock CspA family protein
MNIGLLKWFDNEKGFGVITAINPVLELIEKQNVTSTEASNEIFLHIKNWKDSKPLDSSKIIPVVFETTFERNKIAAKKCEYFKSTKQNWTLLFSHLGNNETIRITERYSSKDYNLISYALKSLTNDFNENVLIESLEEIIKQITNEEIVAKTDTLVTVRKETGNIKLKSLLDKIITKYYSSVASDILLNLWRKDFIPISAISDNDFQKLFELITVEDLNRIKEQKANEELTNLIIIKLLGKLHKDFDYTDYKSFKEIIEIIESDGFKDKIIKDLNSIGQSKVVEHFYKELETIGTIEDNWDLEKIGKLRNSLPDFLSHEIEKEITKAIEYYIVDNSTTVGLIEACVKGCLSEPESIIQKNINDLTNSSLNKIINSKDCFKEGFIIELLEELVSNTSKHDLILDIARKLDDNQIFEKFDNLIFKLNTEEDYFKYWSSGKGKILPKQYLLHYFDDESDKFKNAEEWIYSEYISTEELKGIFENKLELLSNIEDRKEFHTVFNIIEHLVKENSDYIETISKENNQFQLLISWYLGYLEELNFDVLKGKFIYFKPSQQVKIVKKLFRLKKLGKLDLTIEKLDELVRADIDLFLTNEKFNPDIILDLSTSIVIESIKKFKNEGKFLVESELLSIVLREIGLDKTKRFQLAEYFDECQGRMVGEYNWKSKGNIKKVNFGDDSYYFAISFPTGQNKWVNNRWGGYETFVANPDFSDLKEAVRTLPGRKWNSELEHWGVPSRYEKEVLAFAKSNRFFLDFEGSNYKNNTHLIEYKREDIPNGIKFCEGQKAKEEHSSYKCPFWWCSNQACFGHVENLHDIDSWESFTILDFINILGLSVIEKGKYGTFEIGLYNQFISHINRFNQLLDKIYCKECKQILYPVESSNYAAYSVVRFSCENENCKEHHKVVYLNHCLNGKCNSIIDSRDSKKCPNGLYICQNCGSCCSHGMFTRRLSNLEQTGGVIHDDLRLKVENKEGHLERAEYYCHSCGNMMTETSTDIFECFNCNVKYETDKFRFDREYRAMRRKDYPAGKNTNESDDEDDNFPF